MAKCKKCGAHIKFINTTGGKRMPVDVDETYYKEGGKDRIVTPNGMVLAATIINEEDDLSKATGYGYRPHWATCPYADDFRKKKR